jgi:hypothetical protein
MMKPITIRAVCLALSLLAAGCTSAAPDQPPVQSASAVVRPSPTGLQGVMGQDAGGLISQFGQADLDVREGSARKLQFVGPACILDAYLYPSSGSREPVVTHVDARLPDGRDMDRASCVAALSRRVEAR